MPWHSPWILRHCISHSAVQLILLTLRNIYWLVLMLWSCESDSWWRSRVEFDNIVNDTSLYGSDVLNRIEKNWFVSENRIGIFFSESECSTCHHLAQSVLLPSTSPAVPETCCPHFFLQISFPGVLGHLYLCGLVNCNAHCNACLAMLSSLLSLCLSQFHFFFFLAGPVQAPDQFFPVQ